MLRVLSNRNHRFLAPNRLGSVLKRSRAPRETQKEPRAVRSRCLFFTFCLGNMPEAWPVPSIPDHTREGSAGHGRLFWQKIPRLPREMLWDSELKVGEAEGSYNEPGVLFGSITTSSSQGNPHASARF